MDFPIGRYVIVRTESAGVFAGQLDEVDGDVVKMTGARRLWFWAGAASLSELAERGTSKPDQCKFPIEVTSLVVRGWLELLPVSEAAKASIAAVPVWSA